MASDFLRFSFKKNKKQVVNVKKSLLNEPIYIGGRKELNILIEWYSYLQGMINQINSSNPESLGDLKLKSRIMTKDEDMYRVNPYVKNDNSFTVNCSYCSAAYDLRRRGFDVEADDYHNDEVLDNSISSIFEIYSWWTHKNAVFYPVGHGKDTEARQRAFDLRYPGYRYFNTAEFTCDEIENCILEQGGGTRGQLSYIWVNGGAHSVVYEVVNEKVIIRDCQHCRVVGLDHYFKYAKRIYYFRTDNEEPTDRILNCVKNKNSDTLCPGDSKNGTLIERFIDAGFNVSGNKVYLDKTNSKYLLLKDNGSFRYVDPIKEQIKTPR